ncbi:MAG TPA: anthranilate synthase component I family protein [Mucilaginibacter sp.]|nr:anthranilate synthase component I family protein [Mucilaginibacter sp.]
MIKVIANRDEFKAKALQWAAAFDVCCYLDSNNFSDAYSKYDCLIAAGVKNELAAKTGKAFAQLAEFRERYKDWIMGFLSYDLKNETENLTSENPDHLQFPDLYFFVPRYVLIFRAESVEIIAEDAGTVFENINQQNIKDTATKQSIAIQSRLSKTAYLDAIEKIKEHIRRGDIYVTNFCQEFFADDADIDPLAVFYELNRISPNPFSAFFKCRGNYIICASPERFLAKRGRKIISQPIKGTAKRGNNETEDIAIINELRNHTKELQENVMIVDLVRNDLTHSAAPGSVKTEELFGIYSFRQVHQMISTVVCELAEHIDEVQAIKNTFPMGSMTGAPKISAMQLMEQYECSRRGVYSGAIGYFDPHGDFDFNVVIRTILYNSCNKYLSFHAGSAITHSADAEKEYEECLLKARAILETLERPIPSPQYGH